MQIQTCFLTVAMSQDLSYFCLIAQVSLRLSNSLIFESHILGMDYQTSCFTVTHGQAVRIGSTEVRYIHMTSDTTDHCMCSIPAIRGCLC